VIGSSRFDRTVHTPVTCWVVIIQFMTPRDSLRATARRDHLGRQLLRDRRGLKGFPPFLLLTARFSWSPSAIFFVPKPGPWRQSCRSARS